MKTIFCYPGLNWDIPLPNWTNYVSGLTEEGPIPDRNILEPFLRRPV